MPGYIAGVGGVAMDVIARCEGSSVAGDKNPARISTNPGGVTRNICENLARMGERVELLAALGDDSFGREIRALSTAAGIGMSHVLVSGTGRTSCYMAMLDADGDMVTAASDFAIASELSGEYFQRERDVLQGASAVVTDGNLSPSQLSALLDAAGSVPVYIDPVSEAKSAHLKNLVGRFAMIKPNLRELEALSGIRCSGEEKVEEACAELIARGCETVVVSLGENGCYCRTAKGESIHQKLPGRAVMKNATGAGDAFMAGFLSGRVRGLDTSACLDRALAAGWIAVESSETINPAMSDRKISELLDKIK